MTSKVFHAQRFVYCEAHVCYDTAVEHRSLLNRPGICNGIICCNIFCSYSRFEYKKQHLIW